MSIPFTLQQQQALDQQGNELPRMIDPRTNAAYVLVPEAEYESIRDLLEDERQLIHEAALRNAVGRKNEAL